MNKPFTVFLLESGKITGSGSAPEPISLQAEEGEGVISVKVSPDLYFVDVKTRELKKKKKINITLSKESIIADGEDFAEISNIPAGVSFIGPDEIRRESDGEPIIFSVDLPGKYRFRFLHNTYYLDEDAEIEAKPATES